MKLTSQQRTALSGFCSVMVGLALLALFVWIAVVNGGCAKQPTTFTPAIGSQLPIGTVLLDAAHWSQADPANRYYATTANTHSMEPFFTSKSVTLCVRYTGQLLQNGQVVIYNRGDAPRVLHVVSAQTDESVYMSGYNNHDSDGWFKRTTIEGIVVGQLYSP